MVVECLGLATEGVATDLKAMGAGAKMVTDSSPIGEIDVVAVAVWTDVCGKGQSRTMVCCSKLFKICVAAHVLNI